MEVPVLDIKFANYFNKYVDKSYRFVNDNDPIPFFPTAWRFQHVKDVWLYHDRVLNKIIVWRGWMYKKLYTKFF